MTVQTVLAIHCDYLFKKSYKPCIKSAHWHTISMYWKQLLESLYHLWSFILVLSLYIYCYLFPIKSYSTPRSQTTEWSAPSRPWLVALTRGESGRQWRENSVWRSDRSRTSSEITRDPTGGATVATRHCWRGRRYTGNERRASNSYGPWRDWGLRTSQVRI